MPCSLQSLLSLRSLLSQLAGPRLELERLVLPLPADFQLHAIRVCSDDCAQFRHSAHGTVLCFDDDVAGLQAGAFGRRLVQHFQREQASRAEVIGEAGIHLGELCAANGARAELHAAEDHAGTDLTLPLHHPFAGTHAEHARESRVAFEEERVTTGESSEAPYVGCVSGADVHVWKMERI